MVRYIDAFRYVRAYMHVCMYVWLWAFARARTHREGERESLCECVCVCVCVFEREREMRAIHTDRHIGAARATAWMVCIAYNDIHNRALPTTGMEFNPHRDNWEFCTTDTSC